MGGGWGLLGAGRPSVLRWAGGAGRHGRVCHKRGRRLHLGHREWRGENRRPDGRHRLARDEHLPSGSGRMEDRAPSHRLLFGGGASRRHVGGPRRELSRAGASAASALLLALIHKSAWNRNSANFAITEFSEVGLPVPPWSVRRRPLTPTPSATSRMSATSPSSGLAAVERLPSSAARPTSSARRPSSSGGRPTSSVRRLLFSSNRPGQSPLSHGGRLPSSSGPPGRSRPSSSPLAFWPRPSCSLPAGPPDLCPRSSPSPAAWSGRKPARIPLRSPRAIAGPVPPPAPERSSLSLCPLMRLLVSTTVANTTPIHRSAWKGDSPKFAATRNTQASATK